MNSGHPRCYTDEAIRALAKQGGVIGINFISFMVKDLDHGKRTYDLTDGLIRRGYTDPHIRLILGDNWRRVLPEVWGG